MSMAASLVQDMRLRIAVRDVGVRAERRRCVGVLLKAVGTHRLAGQIEIAEAIDALATRLEHPEEER